MVGFHCPANTKGDGIDPQIEDKCKFEGCSRVKMAPDAVSTQDAGRNFKANWEECGMGTDRLSICQVWLAGGRSPW